MDSTEKLLDKEADKQAELDDLLAAQYKLASEMFADLMSFVDNRDQELFEAHGVDPNITALDYGWIQIFERDLNSPFGYWKQRFDKMAEICYWQTFLDICVRKSIKIAEEFGTKIRMVAKNMTKTELVTAGKKGIDRERFKAAKERRKQPA